MEELQVTISGERTPLSDLQNDKFAFATDVVNMPEEVFKRYFKGTSEQYAEFLNEFNLNTSATYKSKQDFEQLPQYIIKFINSAYDKKYISLFDTRLNQVDRGALARHGNTFERFSISLSGISDDKFKALTNDYLTTYYQNNPALVTLGYVDADKKTLEMLSSTLVLYVDESNESLLYSSYESRDKKNIRLTNSIEYPNQTAKAIFTAYVNNQDKEKLYAALTEHGVDEATINDLKIVENGKDDKKFINEVKKSLGIRVDIKKSTNMNLTAMMQHLFITAEKYLDADEILTVKTANGQILTKSDYFFDVQPSQKEMEFLALASTTKSMQKEAKLESRGSMSPNTSKEYVDENSVIDNDNRADTKETMIAVAQEIQHEADLTTQVEDVDAMSDTLTVLTQSNLTKYQAFVKLQMEQIANADELAKKAFEKFKTNILASGNLVDNFNKVNGEMLRGNNVAFERFDFLVKQELINTALKDKIINEFRGIVITRNMQMEALNGTIGDLQGKISDVAKKNENLVTLYENKLKDKEQEVIDVEIVFDEYKVKVAEEIDNLSGRLLESDGLLEQQQKVIEYTKKEVERIPLLERTNDDLKESLKTKDNYINDLKDSVGMKEKTINDLKEKNATLDEEINSLKQENYNLKTKNELLSASNDELKAELERVNKIVAELKQKNQELDTEVSTLKEVFKAKKEATSQEKKMEQKEATKERVVKHVDYASLIDKAELQKKYEMEIKKDSKSLELVKLYLIKTGKLDTAIITDENIIGGLEALEKIGIIGKSTSGIYHVTTGYENLLFNNYNEPLQTIVDEKAYFDYLSSDAPSSNSKFVVSAVSDVCVKINNKVSKEDFNALHDAAKARGGRYTKEGFVFKNTDSAKEFFDNANNVKDDDSSEATSSTDESSKIRRNR